MHSDSFMSIIEQTTWEATGRKWSYTILIACFSTNQQLLSRLFLRDRISLVKCTVPRFLNFLCLLKMLESQLTLLHGPYTGSTQPNSGSTPVRFLKSNKRYNYSCNRNWRPRSLRDLMISYFLDNRLTGEGEVVSLMHRPRFIPQPHLYFCLWSTSGGRSVGIVRSRTKGHGVCLFLFVLSLVLISIRYWVNPRA
jgi:hypothetical protein